VIDFFKYNIYCFYVISWNGRCTEIYNKPLTLTTKKYQVGSILLKIISTTRAVLKNWPCLVLWSTWKHAIKNNQRICVLDLICKWHCKHWMLYMFAGFSARFCLLYDQQFWIKVFPLKLFAAACVYSSRNRKWWPLTGFSYPKAPVFTCQTQNCNKECTRVWKRFFLLLHQIWSHLKTFGLRSVRLYSVMISLIKKLPYTALFDL